MASSPESPRNFVDAAADVVATAPLDLAKRLDKEKLLVVPEESDDPLSLSASNGLRACLLCDTVKADDA